MAGNDEKNKIIRKKRQMFGIQYYKLIIAKIVTSLSWKLTAPLRYLKRKVKTNYFFLLPTIRLIEKSGLFDKEYYLENNPDVKLSGMDPARHYLVFGGFEGRNPSGYFASRFYLQQYTDVNATGMNPLVHYLLYGKKESFVIIPLQNENQLSHPACSNINDSSKTIINQDDSAKKKNGSSEVQLIRNSKLFDHDYYLRMYPEINEDGIDPAEHYFYYGWKEGKNPSEFFNTNFYLNKYHDVDQANMNPLFHYLKTGESENRQSSATSGTKYTRWIKKYDTLSSTDIENMRKTMSQFQNSPLFSVLMPVYNPNPEWLIEAIDSVKNQIYSYWELCIADDCSTDADIRDILENYQQSDSRIKVIYRSSNGNISAASNSSLQLATGEFVVLFDHDDILPNHALFWVAYTINNNPHAKLLYSDEDKIDENGLRQSPYFKCDWNPELFYSQNMISHLGIYQTETVRKIGGFRVGFEGSQDYDLALRFIEHIDESEIIHIPKVLYHWRLHEHSTSFDPNSKYFAYIAGERALNEHLARTKKNARVSIFQPGMYRVQFKIPLPAPQVTLIIPTRNHSNLLRNCIFSILNKTNYSAFDILIIDNQSDDPEFFQLLDELISDNRVACIRDNRPFSYSALNNRAVQEAKGEYVCLLNNDTEVINDNWLSEMISIAVQPRIGAVGAKLYYPDGKIKHAGVILGIGGIASHSHKNLPINNGYFGRAVLMQQMSAVTGACMVVKKSIYLEMGGLDELNLPIAYNDVDFCLRLKKSGYRNIWTPYAELYHHESVSRGRDDTLEQTERFQNEKEYMFTNWKQLIENDPAYNPNLTLVNEKFELAWPPRKVYPIN